MGGEYLKKGGSLIIPGQPNTIIRLPLTRSTNSIQSTMTNKEFFIASWERDSAVTAKAIRSLPADMTKLNMQHHPKFRSPWQLVNHIAPHAKELVQAIADGRMDLVNEGLFPM